MRRRDGRRESTPAIVRTSRPDGNQAKPPLPAGVIPARSQRSTCQRATSIEVDPCVAILFDAVHGGETLVGRDELLRSLRPRAPVGDQHDAPLRDGQCEVPASPRQADHSEQCEHDRQQPEHHGCQRDHGLESGPNAGGDDQCDIDAFARRQQGSYPFTRPTFRGRQPQLGPISRRCCCGAHRPPPELCTTGERIRLRGLLALGAVRGHASPRAPAGPARWPPPLPGPPPGGYGRRDGATERRRSMLGRLPTDLGERGSSGMARARLRCPRLVDRGSSKARRHPCDHHGARPRMSSPTTG